MVESRGSRSESEADCCTVVGDAVETGVGTGAEAERGDFPEEADPEAERVQYPLDILETRFLRSQNQNMVSTTDNAPKTSSEIDKTLLDWHSEKSGDPW
jgi:hypothetical protein